MAKVSFDVNDVVGKHLVLEAEIKGARRFSMRLRIVHLLLRLVQWVSPFPVEVSEEDWYRDEGQ